MNTRTKILLPIIVAVSVCVGIAIGNFLVINSRVESGNTLPLRSGSFNKINALLDLVNRDYVDSVNINQLAEDAIPDILAQLDPHSVYIPVSEAQSANEELEGSFSGIGVQFNIQSDSVLVVAVISGGPSEKLGIMPGDRIVEVNDSAFVGKQITNEFVLKKLRGKKGSSVKLGIKRSGTKETLHYNIKRGDVPLNSVDVFYKITPRTGYIKVNRFTATTYKEFLNAVTALKREGATHMIIDLRGNLGGYLETAIAMINEFLPRGSLIVYTQGKAFPRTDSYADGSGSCQNIKLAVLIDEWSASAGEIFAGAMQDNDRGIIVGRRSFGKGLVQMPVEFQDKSAVRLTIARYYTPSGRCIQKPYEKGKDSGYESDIYNRFSHGEFDEQDSIKPAAVDTVKYYTVGGRVVYGGGGIMPDVFVPRNMEGYSPYYLKLVNHSCIYKFALEYADRNRRVLSQYKDREALVAYLRTQDLVGELTELAQKDGVAKNILGLRISHDLIRNQTEAYIARILLGDSSFYPIINQTDKTVLKALEVLGEE